MLDLSAEQRAVLQVIRKKLALAVVAQYDQEAVLANCEYGRHAVLFNRYKSNFKK